MIRVKNPLSGLLSIILLYFAIFEPGKIPSRWIVEGVIAWTYILLNRKYLNIKPVSLAFKNSESFFLTISIYILATVLVNSSGIVYFITIFIQPFTILSMAYAFTVSFIKHEYSTKNVFDIFIICGVIESVTAILSVTNPQMQRFFLQFYETNRKLYTVIRYHGLAGHLTFVTPMILAIIALYALYLGLTKNLLYLVASGMCVFSATLNARIAVAVYIIAGLIIIITVLRSDLKRMAFELVGVFVLVISMIYVANSFISYDTARGEWVVSGIKEMLRFLPGVDTPNSGMGYLEYYSSWRNVIPTGLKFIIGGGTTIILDNYLGLQFDSGFINDLWLGGIVYLICVYTFYAKTIIELWKESNKNDQDDRSNRIVAIIMIVSLVIGNVKGNVFTGNSIIFAFWLMIYIFKGNCKDNIDGFIFLKYKRRSTEK